MKLTTKNVWKFIKRGLVGVAFPDVCVCCGMEVTEREKQICTFCLLERFQDANPENKMRSAAELLPEGVVAQHALWKFDKGGTLQNLMHQLKYERLTGIGQQLGRQLAHRTRRHPRIKSLLSHYASQSVMVPVPLHYWKYMRRGFNQAFVIAQGMEALLNVPICGIRDVVRTKNTRSQTGFNLQQRNANVNNAFQVKNRSAINNKLVIVVDDVFTTGATTFELSGELLQAGAEGIIILTVAQA